MPLKTKDCPECEEGFVEGPFDCGKVASMCCGGCTGPMIECGKCGGSGEIEIQETRSMK